MQWDFLVNALGKNIPCSDISHEIAWIDSSRNFTLFANDILEWLLYTPENRVVFDSYHLYPELLSEKVRDNYRIIFLGYPDIDPQEKLKQIREYEKTYGWWTTKHDDDKLMSRIGDRILESVILRDSCARSWIDFYNLSDSGETYEGTMESIYRELIT